MNNSTVMDNSRIVDWNIQIDRIVIEGFSLTSYQQQQLKDSLEAELGRMFAGRGVPVGMRSVQGKVVGPSIRLQGSRPAPVQLGKQIAASVYNSLPGEQEKNIIK
jgi:hypothetical protein